MFRSKLGKMQRNKGEGAVARAPGKIPATSLENSAAISGNSV